MTMYENGRDHSGHSGQACKYWPHASRVIFPESGQLGTKDPCPAASGAPSSPPDLCELDSSGRREQPMSRADIPAE